MQDLSFVSFSRKMRIVRTLRLGGLLASFSCFLSAEAISFPLTSRPRFLGSPSLKGRTIDMNGSFGNGSTLVDNSANRIYFINVTLGGSQFEVEIDTGRYAAEILWSRFWILTYYYSSDLWVAGDVANTTDLHIQSGVSYAVGASLGIGYFRISSWMVMLIILAAK